MPMPKTMTKPAIPARRPALGPALVAAALACAVPACFFQPREAEEIFDVPLGTGEYCLTDTDCDDGNACTLDTCVTQQDYAGMCTSSHNPGVPDDHEPCTIDHCEDGVPVHEPAAKGTPCGAGGALACDGKGACLGCGSDGSACGSVTECLSWACKSDVCVKLPVVKGLVLTEQEKGDCAMLVCDGQGGTQNAFDAMDHMPVPGQPCTVTVCEGLYNLQLAAGLPCATECVWSFGEATVEQKTCTASGDCVVQSGGQIDVCAPGDGCSDGACLVGCQTDADCGMSTCQAGACAP